MIEHVFRAADSDSAMDKAIRELGDDAMILSVKRVGDFTEVRAIKESLASVANRPDIPFPRNTKATTITLSDALRSASARRDDQLERPETVAPAKKKPASLNFLLDDDIPPTRHAPHLAPAAAEPPVQNIFHAEPETPVQEFVTAEPEPLDETLMFRTALRSEPDQPDSRPAYVIAPPPPPPPPPAMPETPPDNLEPRIGLQDILASEEPQTEPREETQTGQQAHILSLNGFTSDIVYDCISRPELSSLEEQLAHACKALAQRLCMPPDLSSPLDSEIVFIFGPGGSGKTTTAAQIAVQRKTQANTHPSLFSLGPERFVKDQKLDRYAELLNVPLLEALEHATIDEHNQLIIDCNSSDASFILDVISELEATYPAARILPVLALPATWSVLAIGHYCADFKSISPNTIITHLQIGGLGIAGMSELATHNATLLAASESERVSDGIALIDAPAIEQFLRDTFSYTDAKLYAAV